MRVVKEAEERRSEILDAAEKLFSEKGFDGTSTNDILDEVGIARGTLYYHFKAKEDILDAMIDRITGRLIQKAKKIAAKKANTENIQKEFPEVEITVATIDECLNEKGYIVPGMGDAGDRIFNTVEVKN